MSRLKRLQQLNDHAWYGRITKAICESEVERMKRFIEENDHLDKNAFVDKINATFVRVGSREDTLAAELLTVTNFEGIKR